MKILIDARMVSTQLHGIARYTIDLIHGLNELGQEISLIVNNKKDVDLIGLKSIHDTHICPAKFASPMEAFALSRIQNSEKYDVIHFPSFSVPLTAPWEKVIITIHDLIHLHDGFKPFHQLYYKTAVAKALVKAKGVIAVSEWTKKDILEKLRTPHSQINVVRNGLEDRWFNVEEKAESKPPFFMALSNLKNHKNLWTLIQACKDLWKENLNFHLYVSLGGKDIPDSWGLTPQEISKIKVLKNVSDLEIKNHILKSKALISTSRFEGFNYPAAEALALGKSVLISSGSANDELQGSKLYFYGNPEDVSGLKSRMRTLIQNETISGTNHHNIYSRKMMAQKTLEVYGK